MDANKIEKFIDAGYTKEEIELLFKDPKVEPEPEKKEPEKKEPEKKEPEKKDPEKKEPEQGDNNTMANAIKTLTDTVNALSETVKAIQAENIDKGKTEKLKDDTIEGVMQSFIEKL